MTDKKKSPKKAPEKKIREPIREKNKGLKVDSPKKKSKTKATPKVEKSIERVEVNDSQDKKTQSELNFLKIATILLGIIFFIFVVIFLISYLADNREDNLVAGTTESNLKELSELNIEDLTLTMIVNKDCAFCQEALIAEDMMRLLNISNLSVREILVNSTEAQEIKNKLSNEELQFEFSPLFILSQEIRLHELFNESDFQRLFIQVDELFVLSPQVSQVKYLDTEFEVPNESIRIGNEEGVQIVYISDYFCQRCRIMEGDVELINSAEQQGVVPANYSAPIPQLLLSALYANSSSDLTYNFVFVPAPINENSTLSHRAVFCADKQDKFVQMHATLMNNNDLSYTQNEYTSFAQNLGLDIDSFNSCFNSEETDNYINSTQEYLIDLGVTSLPILMTGKYPVTNILDSQTLELLLRSEIEVNQIGLTQ